MLQEFAVSFRHKPPGGSENLSPCVASTFLGAVTSSQIFNFISHRETGGWALSRNESPRLVTKKQKDSPGLVIRFGRRSNVLGPRQSQNLTFSAVTVPRSGWLFPSFRSTITFSPHSLFLYLFPAVRAYTTAVLFVRGGT